MEFLGDAINLFGEEVIESGLKRDLKDYASSISQSQNMQTPISAILNYHYPLFCEVPFICSVHLVHVI